jgi:hypothetical protein
MTGLGKCLGNGQFSRRHPVLQLAYLVFGFNDAGSCFKNMLLARRLEISGNCLFQCTLVFRNHPVHAFELLDSPFIGTSGIAGEIRFLGVKKTLEPVDGWLLKHY